MDIKSVSIIIPVYNEEVYLKRCLSSVVSQTYSKLEIILVDDGSTDGSPDICDHFARQDSRICVIHQNNQGLSAARNAGLDLASSDYIQFVDGNDWILPTMTEELMAVLQEDSSDVSQCSFYMVSEQPENEMLHFDFDADENNLQDRRIYSGDDLHLQLTRNHMHTVVQWNKLFKRKVLDGLRFPVGKLHEDEFIIHRELAQMKAMSCLNRKLYVYMQNPKSITHQRSLKNHLHICEAYLDRTQFYVEKKIYSAAAVAYTMLLRNVTSLDRDARSQGITQIDGQAFQDWLSQMKQDIKTIPNNYFP